MVGTHTDISKSKESEEIVWKQANFDALTGLPNRRMFFDRLNEEIKRASRRNGLFAMMFLDLDGFKQVNDQLGHQAGDELLVQVSERIGQTIRDSDTFARLGGDEFTIILSNIESLLYIDKVAAKILKVLNEPFMLGTKQAKISASIGISIYPDHGKDSDTLISLADTAMYDAKAKGKNCWAIFNQP
jgi:diguanylate cyclase (GGDEF)-like protein